MTNLERLQALSAEDFARFMDSMLGGGQCCHCGYRVSNMAPTACRLPDNEKCADGFVKWLKREEK